ncbi:asparagine synthase C-terminal domain-containing protein [Phenylobacterium sp.]|uniref:asparagine synthase-related protein n=1 Tax=Phenylobacterium sp. TaxID=1871053 RepID=UPI0025F72434|nr:asparagine synthase C-terminal domain-containing protein [Phenylobacterium sp.]
MSYLAVCRNPRAPEPAWLGALARAVPPQWSVHAPAPGVLVARAQGRRAALIPQPWGVVIGELFGGTMRGCESAREQAAGLLDRAWGAYVALICEPRSGEWSVLRDPSGALDAVVWRRDGAVLIAGDLQGWLAPWLPADLAIDWSALAGLLADPVRVSGRLALSGLSGLAPGEFWSGGEATLLWSPAKAARREATPACEAMCALPDLVDEVVRAMAGERVLIELSGGLDSAIVASALRSVGKAPACALNYHTDDPGADERAYAQMVAERLGFQLTAASLGAPVLDLVGLAMQARGPRPPFNALDQQHEADVSARCEALHIDTLLTGQGGDHVFFQAPSALIAADGARHGPQMLAVLSRRLGCSAWNIIGEAWKARFAAAPARPMPAYLTRQAWAEGLRGESHPWLLDLDGLAPGKRLQAASLAGALSLIGASRRGEAAQLRHPLLSQPVMEACLRISVGDLTAGGHDRALARAAFASRLPAAIIARQGKGRLTAHYGRAIAAGLRELSPLILEGRLASQGLLDREVLARMLSVEHLAWRGGFGAILSLAAVELWVQAWEARIGARS